MSDELVQITDNSTKHQLVERPDVRLLDHVRVTSIKHFKECPRSWANAVFGTIEGIGIGARVTAGPSENANKYSRIGTAVHLATEHYLRGFYDVDNDEHWSAWADYLKGQETPPEEIKNARTYIMSLRDEKPNVIALEVELEMNIPGFEKRILGHIDVVYKSEMTNGIKVQDHKTNRSYNDRAWWRQQMQPRLYSYGARRRWPDHTLLQYEIGYANLDSRVTWETSPSEDDDLEVELADIWKQMVHYSETGIFPEKQNENCGWCPLAASCPTFNATMRGLKESFLAMIEVSPLEDVYGFVRGVRAAAEKYEGIVEEKLREKLRDSSSQSLAGHEFEVYTEQGKRRAADFHPVWEAIATYLYEHPECGAGVRELLPDLFTVKVGGVDKLAKRYPLLGERVSPHLTEKPFAQTTLKVRPKSTVRK